MVVNSFQRRCVLCDKDEALTGPCLLSGAEQDSVSQRVAAISPVSQRRGGKPVQDEESQRPQRAGPPQLGESACRNSKPD